MRGFYESAAALARDVQRYLADEPVKACPPSALYRLRKFARKHKAALGITSACALLLLIGVIVSTWQALVTAKAFALVLFVGVVISTWLAVRAMLAEGREREVARQMQLERDRAQVALTRQVAQRLDAEMRQLAAVGHSIEATLAQREDWQESHLTSWLTDLLSSTLASCVMGTRLYVAGSESFIGSAVQVAIKYNLNADEVQREHCGSAARRVYCIHCKASTENVTTNVVKCTGCGRHLLVRDHYSRRLGAYMGVMVDAEAPGKLPTIQDVFA